MLDYLDFCLALWLQRQQDRGWSMWMGVGWYRATATLTESTEAHVQRGSLTTVLVKVDAQQEVPLVGLAEPLTLKGCAP